ncbi:membrane bound metal dependent hydrolase [Staphylococcus gallinarum]|uniref:Membrane bound metal dependent hydrolase n=1 Tax=Staphylococcus gallinarum TaxID=1293 RepID=A0A380FIH4_STAGA|nr:membrane bound metal dependent hydrolase [Staphylococcus gallinarum]
MITLVEVLVENIVFSDKSKRHPFPSDDLMDYVKNDKNIKTFLNFSSIYRWQATKNDDGTTEIRLIDLRYLKKRTLFFCCHCTSRFGK